MIERLKHWAILAAIYSFCALVCVVSVGAILNDMGFRWGPHTSGGGQ